MDDVTRKHSEEAGFQSVTVGELLSLSPEEEALVEIKLALSNRLRQLRGERGRTQEAFGQEIGATQTRIARMEGADRSVSTELLMKALLRAGASREELGAVIAGNRRKRRAFGGSAGPSHRIQSFPGTSPGPPSRRRDGGRASGFVRLFEADSNRPWR